MLAPYALFASVEAVLPTHFGRLDALAVDDAGARGEVASLALAPAPVQFTVDALLVGVGEDGAPVRLEVARKAAQVQPFLAM